MKAMILKECSPIEERPLKEADLPVPVPEPGEVLVKVSVCGVCHTELDEIEGRLRPHLPAILGHEIVGRVERLGKGAGKYLPGDRVGIAWIHDSCGLCSFCENGLENLCSEFQGTGCHANGGYAQYTVVHQDYAYPVPDRFSDAEAAPLLCAGAIGYRNLMLSGMKRGQVLGLFGFGASAHIVLQMATYLGYETFVFTRSEEHRHLARKVGATWTGRPEEEPPRKLHGAIDFTPVGETLPRALRALEKGGRMVLAVIRKRTPVPPLDYTEHLWDEKEIKSVANITRKDVRDFLSLAAEIPIIPEVEEYKLEEANQVLLALKQGKIRGAAVLKLPE